MCFPSNFKRKNCKQVLIWTEDISQSILGGRVGVDVGLVGAVVVVGIVWLRYTSI